MKHKYNIGDKISNTFAESKEVNKPYLKIVDVISLPHINEPIYVFNLPKNEELYIAERLITKYVKSRNR